MSLVFKIAVLYLLSVYICDAHIVIGWIWPEVFDIKYNLWLDKGYHEPISTSWYLYELEKILADAIQAYMVCLLADLFNLKMYKISLVFLVYYITQFAFYMIDRNTVFERNVVVYIIMAGLLPYFLWGRKAKIVTMK